MKMAVEGETRYSRQIALFLLLRARPITFCTALLLRDGEVHGLLIVIFYLKILLLLRAVNKANNPNCQGCHSVFSMACLCATQIKETRKIEKPNLLPKFPNNSQTIEMQFGDLLKCLAFKSGAMDDTRKNVANRINVFHRGFPAEGETDERISQRPLTDGNNHV
jgi:hypothetical protein